MSIEYDFNIDNYNIDDLENFLQLTTKNYTEFDVNQREIKLRSAIISSIPSNNKQTRDTTVNKVITFLEEAKRLLIEQLNKTKLLSSGSDSMILDKGEKSLHSLTQYIEPVPAYQAQYPKGILNQLKKRITSYTLCMNTLFRDPKMSTSTDAVFNLPYTLKNVVALKLASLEFSETIYMFSEKKKSNRIYIEEDNTGLRGVVHLPEGNYDDDTIVPTLQDSINNTLGSGSRFEVIVNPINGKTTIKNTTNTFTMNIQYETDTNPFIYKNLGWALGYREKEYFGYDTYTSEGIYSSVPLQYIYFVLNDFAISNTNTILAIFNNGYSEKNILAKIPVPVDNFQVLFDNASDLITKKREYFGPIDITKVGIKLLDQYGDVIDMNNMNYSFTIELDIAYDI
jgi:hypothetical protein